MARTSTDAVKTLLQDDWGLRADGSEPNLSPRVEAATVVVDRLVSLATDQGVTINNTEAELIERALAAHYYTLSDPVYASRNTLRGGGNFVRNQKQPEPYRDMAIGLDPSHLLGAILDGRIAGFDWLGKVESDQIALDQRD